MNLIVGATGMLGGEICRLLAEQGSAVRVLVRESSNPEKVDRLRGLGAEVVRGDLNCYAIMPTRVAHGPEISAFRCDCGYPSLRRKIDRCSFPLPSPGTWPCRRSWSGSRYRCRRSDRY
jgi:NAD(P)-dependent dehydrogenase (short-subunit alcohol dehydrogenase family)